MTQATLARVPTVAVITVCRNALQGLRATATSVHDQSAPGIVHVVIDGGSTDGTPEWLAAHPSWFAVAVSEPDRGIYDAMNKALKLCPEVDWIVFLNAGDTFHDVDVVRASWPLLQRDDADFVFGDVAITDAAGPGVARHYPARRSARVEMPGCHQSCFVRGTVMKRLGFDPHYKVAADFECWLRAARGGSRTAFLAHTVATVAPEGYSAQNEATLQSEYTRVIRTHVGPATALGWLLKRKGRRMALAARRLLRGR